MCPLSWTQTKLNNCLFHVSDLVVSALSYFILRPSFPPFTFVPLINCFPVLPALTQGLL